MSHHCPGGELLTDLGRKLAGVDGPGRARPSNPSGCTAGCHADTCMKQKSTVTSLLATPQRFHCCRICMHGAPGWRRGRGSGSGAAA